MNYHKLTVREIVELIKKKKASAIEITNDFLAVIKKKDPEIKAFITVCENSALKRAKDIDAKIRKGEKVGKLAGVPYALKDNFLTKGIQTTSGSRILENYIPQYSAEMYERLQNEDAVLLGKTNMDTFAFGVSTENSGYFVTKNPHDLTRVPGGSSGGSAAAVASNMCAFALGSDTGGSIRQPSAFCGVVGLKPTYGRNSRYGMTAMASSFDCPGPITKTVEDSAIIEEILAGPDEKDSTTSPISVPDYYKILTGRNLKEGNNAATGSSVILSSSKEDTGRAGEKWAIAQKSKEKLRIGLPKEYFIEGMQTEVEDAVKKTAAKFEEMGAEIKKISLLHTDYALAVYYILVPSEISSNMARYDGIRFGPTIAGADNINEFYMKVRGKFMEPELKRRIMIGSYALSAGYYDAYFMRAAKVRTLIKQDFENAFQDVDAIIAPTTPTTAFRIGEKSDDPLQMYLADIFTVSANVAGIPSLNIPIGKDKEGLPIGLQIMGNYFEEGKIFQIASLISS